MEPPAPQTGCVDAELLGMNHLAQALQPLTDEQAVRAMRWYLGIINQRRKSLNGDSRPAVLPFEKVY
jgi:hypothetical protein